MTIDDLKKLDKRLRQIQDPFGTGYPAMHRLWQDCAGENGLTISQIERQYAAWKLRK